MEYILKGGQVIDPKTNVEEILDIRVINGKIAAIGQNITTDQGEVIDLTGKIVAPGFIDMHVHLREPGGEAHETILTGCQAAAAGGFTAIAAMPNTKPSADNESVIELVIKRAKDAGLVRVYPIGAVSKGQKGQEITEMGNLCKAGAVAVSDDGRPVENSEVMRRALEYSQIFNIPVISHCEDISLAGDGLMHEGYWSTVLGLKGIPAEAEETMAARDIILARLTGGRLHLAHLSTQGSMELLRFARSQGIKVTAEVTPHHILLTDEAVKGYDTSTKVNPPLRSRPHVEAIRKAVKEGLISSIVTDHAPWASEEKDNEYAKAPNGISGLETAIPVCWDTLVVNGELTPMEFITLFTTGPAEILNLPLGSIAEGENADITVIDPKLVKKIEVKNFYSKGKNSPLDGRSFQGWPVLTMVEGRIVMQDGKVKEAKD